MSAVALTGQFHLLCFNGIRQVEMGIVLILSSFSFRSQNQMVPLFLKEMEVLLPPNHWEKIWRGKYSFSASRSNPFMIKCEEGWSVCLIHLKFLYKVCYRLWAIIPLWQIHCWCIHTPVFSPGCRCGGLQFIAGQETHMRLVQAVQTALSAFLIFSIRKLSKQYEQLENIFHQ